MADEERETCEHNGCDCLQADDSDYCSPYCEAAGESDTVGLACECGHPGCAGLQ